MPRMEDKMLGVIYRHYPMNRSDVQRIFDTSGSYDRTIAIIEQGLELNVDPVMLATSKVDLRLNGGENILEYRSRIDGALLYKLKVGT